MIRGWGTINLLRPVPHVVCVRVCAPMELRIRRMMERLNTGDEEFCANEIRLSDEAHAAIIQRHFGVDWRDPVFYDLVLNTERVPIEDCVKEVLNLVNNPVFRETPESRVKLHDLALQARIRAALRSTPETSKVQISIDANNGDVTLSGIVERDQERLDAEQVVSQVPGVTKVKNNLKVAAVAKFKMGD